MQRHSISNISGELESEMLPMLLRGYPRINNRVLEPAEDQMMKYKAMAQSKRHELQGVKFDWRQQTLEQYRDTDGDGTKFHFISSIDSLYYVGDLDSSLMYLYDLLEPGGKLIVVITSGTRHEFYQKSPLIIEVCNLEAEEK